MAHASQPSPPTPLPPGKVYLVGAGSGDPGLLTVKGARLLEQAQVVVYDYLVNCRLLDYCPKAEQIYVGKKAAQHTLTQEQINNLLIAKAREGKSVVRLKGGDPFVFGRGGEECEALRAAGIGFEVVPGITAAIAAPNYAGIPVTHRDFNSSFTIITGHEKEEDYKDPQAKARGEAAGSSDLDWSAIARLPAMAFYMGVKALPRICRNLMDHGMSPQMPAATIQWGTTPKQRTVVATLADLPEKVAAAGLTAPAITIIGKVVTLRDTMNWFETRPLFGQTVVVTRTRQQVSELSDELSALGANVIEAPTIELIPAASFQQVDQAMLDGQFDWLIFTSANGVRFARQRLKELNKDVRCFGRAQVAAIGQVTARAIEDELALNVDLCPPSFVAEALADALIQQGQATGKRFLLLRADIARPILRERLVQAGAAEVRDVPIYQTTPATALTPQMLEALDAKQVHWITFTSSSTAKNFLTLLGDNYKEKLKNVKLASIGPVTTKTLQEMGLEPTVQAETFTIPGLVAAISGSVK